MEENKENLLERILGFAKEILGKPWIYSSSEENHLSSETRSRNYEAMNRYV